MARLTKFCLDVDRVSKDDDVAVLDGGVRQKVFADAVGWGIGHLVDDDMVANEQIVFHGRTRDHKGLRDGRHSK